MDLVAHLDFNGDPHLVAVLFERCSNIDGSFWKTSVAGHGVIEIAFDSALDKHLSRGQVLWIWGLTFLEPRHAVATLSAGTRICFRPPHHAKISDGRIAELFSGFAGWTHGARLLGKETSYMIEIDEVTARAASAATGIPAILFEETWKQFLHDGSIPEQAIFIGDANDDRIWTILSIMNVRHVLFSTNCQPWSSIGHERGLNVQMGLNTPAMFRKGRDYAMATMTFENVNGFRMHPHYHVVTAFAEQMGFECIHQDIDGCEGVLPLLRDRWLGSFIDRSLVPFIPPERRLAARDLHLPSDPFLGGLIGCGALFHDLPIHHLQELLPDTRALELLSDPQLLPSWWNSHGNDVLKSRIVPNTKPWKGLVATYGRQHDLDFELLSEKGLHTCLLHSTSGPRYISPWEAAAALGLPNTIRLPLDLQLCWQLVGNGISVAHVILQLSRLHIVCGSMSPFASETVPSLVHLCRAMQRKGLKLPDFIPACIGGHRVLINKSDHPEAEGAIDSPARISEIHEIVRPTEPVISTTEVADSRSPPPFDLDLLRPAKWLKANGFDGISPTVPYDLDEDDAKADSKPIPRVGLQFLPALSFRELLDQCRKVQQQPFFQVEGKSTGIVILASTLSRWAVITWAPHGRTVIRLLHGVLPHVKPEWIKGLMDHDTTVDLDSIPYSNPFRVIRFCPVDVLCKLQLPCAQNPSIIHNANVLTKASDWIAEFAGRFNVPAYMMELRCHGKLLDNDCFVLSLCCTKSFSLHWVVPFFLPAISPSDDVHQPLDLQASSHWESPRKEDTRLKNGEGLVGFAAKHPLWNTIRSVAFPSHEQIGVVFHELFPDLVSRSEPVIAIGGVHVPLTTRIADIPTKNVLRVELNGDRPIPITTVYPIEMQLGFCQFQEHDEAGDKQFRRWVRSPFRLQASHVALQGDLTLLELGGSFLCQVPNSVTTQVTLNHKLVDPLLKIKETPIDATIGFRICPLPGGAKNDLANIITQALKSRGVPSDVVESRTKSILATIPNEQIRSHIKEPDVTFWTSLKRLASEHRIRLVTTSELKTFQKEQRNGKKPTAASSNVGAQPKGQGKGAKGKTKGISSSSSVPPIDLASVQLQMRYLIADDQPTLPVLPKADFGVDQVGVTLMTEDEAVAFFPIKSLSTGPLAILAMCDAESAGSDLVMLPAINKAGEPILLPVTIHNFGDIAVKFHPGDKCANTPAVATQVIEVIIRRSLVEEWPKARDCLQYLASYIPALKNGSVIAHWSIKSFGSNKKPSSFEQAAYIHGYLRCKNENVDDVLKMSGRHGIFTIPRDDNRRPDPAFAIITASESLEHMLIQAQKHVTTLGVIEVNGGFAYRTRRENLQSLRRALMPNSVWSEEGQPRAGDEMYILKHVAVITGAPQLTDALQSLGWDAVGIKPIGQNTWSIAAAHPPPSPHLLINGHFTIAVPAHEKSKKDPETYRTLASFPRGTSVSAVPTTIADDDMATVSHHQTRICELRHDLTEQLDQLVEKKLQETKEQVGILQEAITIQDTKIDRIENAVTQVQSDVKDQNIHVETRLSSIEQSVTSQGNSMLAQMNGMLQTFQNTLMSRLDAIEGGDHKRPRKDGQ